jgi:hypothetical protein
MRLEDVIAGLRTQIEALDAMADGLYADAPNQPHWNVYRSQANAFRVVLRQLEKVDTRCEACSERRRVINGGW